MDMFTTFTLRTSVHSLTISLWPAQLRNAFVQNDWVELERAIYIMESVEGLSEHKECLSELKAARWQLEHHNNIEALRTVSTRKVFASVSTKVVDWSGLLSGTKEVEATITTATKFESTCRGASSTLPSMIRFVEDLLKLRRLVAQKECADSKSFEASFRVDKLVTLSTLGILSNVDDEMKECRRLVNCMEVEELVISALDNVPTCGELTFKQNFFSAFSSSTERMMAALQRAGSVAEQSDGLMDKLKVISLLLRTRDSLSALSVSAGTAADWNALITEYSEAAKGIDDFQVYPKNLNEFKVSLKEMRRRQIYYGFLSTIVRASVTGEAGRLVIGRDVDSKFEQSRTTAARLAQFKDELGVNLAAELEVVQQFVFLLSDLRKVVQEKDWDGATLLLESSLSDSSPILAAMRQLADLSKDTEVEHELGLLRSETAFQTALIALRASLKDLTVFFSDNGIMDKSRLDTKVLRKSVGTLTRFMAATAEVPALIAFGSDVANTLETIREKPMESIDVVTVKHIGETYALMKIDSTMFQRVLDYVQFYQIISSLHAAAKSPRLHSDHVLVLTILKISQNPNTPAAANSWLEACKQYMAVETAVEFNDWLAASAAAEELLATLNELNVRVAYERDLANFLRERGTERRQEAKSKQIKAHYDIVMHTGSMKKTSGGLALAVPSKSNDLIQDFLDNSKRVVDAAESEIFAPLFADALALLNVRQRATVLAINAKDVLDGVECNVESSAHLGAAQDQPIWAAEESCVSNMDQFLKFSQELDIAACKDVIKWNKKTRQAQVNLEVYYNQVDKMHKILDIFPHAMENYSLLKVLSALHSAAAPIIRDDRGINVDAIRNLRNQLSKESISPECHATFNRQMVVFEKAAIAMEMKETTSSGMDLFSDGCYNRDAFDELLAKLAHLGAAIGGEDFLSNETKLTVRALSVARELCVACSLQSREECKKYSLQLDEISARLPECLSNGITMWSNAIPLPPIFEMDFSNKVIPPPEDLSHVVVTNYMENVNFSLVHGIPNRGVVKLVSELRDDKMILFFELLATILLGFSNDSSSNILFELNHNPFDQDFISATELVETVYECHARLKDDDEYSASISQEEALLTLYSKLGTQCVEVGMQYNVSDVVLSFQSLSKLLADLREALVVDSNSTFSHPFVSTAMENMAQLTGALDERSLYMMIGRSGIALDKYNPFAIDTWIASDDFDISMAFLEVG